MYESNLPFLQSEVAYRTDRIKAAAGGRRPHLPARLHLVRRGGGPARPTADPATESTKPW